MRLKRDTFFKGSAILVGIAGGLPFGLSFVGYSLGQATISLLGSTATIWASSLLSWPSALLSAVLGMCIVSLPLLIAYASITLTRSPDTTSSNVPVNILEDTLSTCERAGAVVSLTFYKMGNDTPTRKLNTQIPGIRDENGKFTEEFISEMKEEIHVNDEDTVTVEYYCYREEVKFNVDVSTTYGDLRDKLSQYGIRRFDQYRRYEYKYGNNNDDDNSEMSAEKIEHGDNEGACGFNGNVCFTANLIRE